MTLQIKNYEEEMQNMFTDCYEEEKKVNSVEIQFLEESNKNTKVRVDMTY